MKEAFEKIKKELRAKKDNVAHNLQLFREHGNERQVSFCETKLDTYVDALSIVFEVEAEYGNGWIPCSERLPEEPSVYLVCYKNPNCFPSVQLFSGGRFLNYYLEEDKHIIAWMPLPSPYKPTND